MSTPHTTGIQVFEFPDDEVDLALQKFFPAPAPAPKPVELTLMPIEFGFKGNL